MKSATTINDFELITLVGQSPMAHVYKARDKRKGETSPYVSECRARKSSEVYGNWHRAYPKTVASHPPRSQAHLTLVRSRCRLPSKLCLLHNYKLMDHCRKRKQREKFSSNSPSQHVTQI
eukprot:GHVN01042744.1.p1 GENE.GHVN01042744.1~~GHVN01042744.1.p1  ORF type:complete len:120 (+),score=9.84 GHVN01042744.1:174-533(+)